MELVNQTPAPAALYVSQVSAEWKSGFLVAKVTFQVGPGGQIRIVEEDPMPVLDMDQETSSGTLPRDLVARRASGLDVVLLGAAYAPGGRPTRELMVAMRVGSTTRHLKVSGDRHWVGTGDAAYISEPEPFVRMALTWDRAFGGGGDVWLDPHTVLPARHPGNPNGRGYDIDPIVHGYQRTGAAAEGFPRSDYVRELPNLEHPLEPIRAWSDAPDPYCWAAIPPGVAAFLAARQARVEGSRAVFDQPPLATSGHPDWRLPIPAAGEPVVLEGCHHAGPWWFAWPRLAVSYDYEIGARRGARHLEPYLLVLLPEEDRFTISFRDWFKFPHNDTGEPRSVRLRVE